MLCPHCQRTVPEESRFCLACGQALERPPGPLNGHGVAPDGLPLPEVPEPAVPSRKGAWALSFAAITDERIRYRVARWVIQQAPAHPLGEVQEGLRQGSFFTFLALTPAEADQVRTGIQRLGLPESLINLAPASGLESLGRPAPRTARRARPGRGYGQWLLFGLATASLAVAALIALRLLAGRGF